MIHALAHFAPPGLVGEGHRGNVIGLELALGK